MKNSIKLFMLSFVVLLSCTSLNNKLCDDNKCDILKAIISKPEIILNLDKYFPDLYNKEIIDPDMNDSLILRKIIEKIKEINIIDEKYEYGQMGNYIYKPKEYPLFSLYESIPSKYRDTSFTISGVYAVKPKNNQGFSIDFFEYKNKIYIYSICISDYFWSTL